MAVVQALVSSWSCSSLPSVKNRHHCTLPSLCKREGTISKWLATSAVLQARALQQAVTAKSVNLQPLLDGSVGPFTPGESPAIPCKAVQLFFSMLLNLVGVRPAPLIGGPLTLVC